ncbi:MAG: hypothetical protein LUC95_01215, partial [Lachnospiraceae bacterium]|nr:hypothetical protein [Lachnospiraceae bacterium]
NGHPPDVQRPQSPLNITVGDGPRILSERFITYKQKNPVRYCNSSCNTAQGFLCLLIFFNCKFSELLLLLIASFCLVKRKSHVITPSALKGNETSLLHRS